MHLNKTPKTALIDTELLLYKNAAKIDNGSIDFREAARNVEAEISGIIEVCGATSYQNTVSGPNNFRKTLYPDTYKANRPSKPAQYYNLLEAIKYNHKNNWQCHDQLEADDLLGIMATNGKVENPIICSIDKDMLTIPGWHFQWHHDSFPHLVTQVDADRFWLTQLLTGDSTDGIAGMKGIGQKKAEILIEKHTQNNEEIYDFAKFRGHEASIPMIAKYIYKEEGFSLDEFYACLFTVTILRHPMPIEILKNDLIFQIIKTIPSLNSNNK